MTTQIWNNVPSRSLGMRATLTVVTPEGSLGAPAAWPSLAPPPVDQEPGLAILLHGLTGNNAVWAARDDLARLATEHNLVFALPDGARSFWVDQEYGLNYGRWVGVELPQIMRATLRVSRERNRTFIGGFSMGGYGAFRALFDYPGTFGGAFSLSGTLDVAEAAFRGRHPDLYRNGFGSADAPRGQDDLVARLTGDSNLAGDLKGAKLFGVCGDHDRLLRQNRRFAAAAEAAGLDYTYKESSGAHSFEFWNRWLPEALDAVTGSYHQRTAL